MSCTSAYKEGRADTAGAKDFIIQRGRTIDSLDIGTSNGECAADQIVMRGTL